MRPLPCLVLLGCTTAGPSGPVTPPAADSGATDANVPADTWVPPPSCSDVIPCENGLACCSGFCADTSRDWKNCGACGVACTEAQYCDGKACLDATFANVCHAPKATVVLDGIAADDEPGMVLGAALVGCGLAVQYVPTWMATGVLADDGRPMTGPGNMLVTVGGSYTQPSVAYMEASLSPIFTRSAFAGQNLQVVVRATQATLLDIAVSSLSPAHDYFVLQIAYEPSSASLCLIDYGFYAPGTKAAAWYTATNVLPHRGAYTDRWYVYEWQDTDVSGDPSIGDVFAKKASGK